MDVLAARFFGNSVEEYLVAAGLILAGIVVSLLVNGALNRYIHSLTERTETDLDDVIVKEVLSPLAYTIMIVGVVIAKDQLKLSPALSTWIDRVCLALGLGLFFLIIIRSAKALVGVGAAHYLKRLRKKSPEDYESQKTTVEHLTKQIGEILTMVLAVLAVLTVLSNLGLDLKAIWASLGIGGIAIALAVKEPLSNLVGRMYIYSTSLFDEGHYIKFKDIEGTVKKITGFRTYVEVFSDMTTVSIPNADFVNGTVKSYFGRNRFRYKWDLDVPYDVSAVDLQDLVGKLRELVLAKPEINPDACYIYLDRLDKYSKVVRVWFVANLPAWKDSLFYGNGLLHEIQLLFETMKVEFAFPTQTVSVVTEEPLRVETESAPVTDRNSVDRP